VFLKALINPVACGMYCAAPVLNNQDNILLLIVALTSEIGIVLYVNISKDAVVVVKDMTSNCQHCLVCKWGRQSRKCVKIGEWLLLLPLCV
jgi:hypothetical protein